MSGMTTAATLSLVATGLSTGLSAFGMIQQQNAMATQASYQAQIAARNQQIMEANAKQAEWQSRDAIERGKVAEQQQRTKTGQMLGAQTARLAAQGTDMAGSPTDILGDTARAGEFDALTIRNNAVREAWGYDTKAWNMRVGAQNYGTEAAFRGSFQPSYIGAGASLLSGASTLADKWSRFQDVMPVGSDGVSPASRAVPAGSRWV